MSFDFSIGWLVSGIVIVLVGILIVKFYDKISENFASGVASYGHVKLAGLIAIGIGMAAATNLIPLLMTALVQIIFGGMSSK